MNARQISLPAIKRLYTELEPFEKKAKKEMKDQRSRAIGIIRLDLIEECRRRLTFLTYMVRDAEERAKETRRSNQSG
ncbi:MAG: hypothetical protein JWO91_552 [Acidobacteriaceae bacterium]|jgi:hypothetical protein|nr:hypothetical protein [Acidobacteriaceae bacterium]